MQQFLRGFGGFYQFDVSVCDFFSEKIRTAMASPLRGIQGQCNIKCLEPQQKCDKLTRWGWHGMTRTTEQKLFSNPELWYLTHNTETQLPCSYFKTQSTDATDNWHSPLSASQVLAGIPDMYRPTYRSTGWPTLSQVLTNIAIDMLTNSWPIWRLRGDWYSADI